MMIPNVDDVEPVTFAPMTGLRHKRGPVMFGVLGCADIAWRRTLPALKANRDIRLRAIASRDAAKAAKFAGRFGGIALGNYAAMLDRQDVQAVYIPLPAMLHAEWIERALLAGKHVLAEKPLSTDAADTERLINLARERGLKLLENMMFLQHPQHGRVDELVAQGAIGDIRSLMSSFTIPPKPDDDIRYQLKVGGGALDDIGVYPIRAATRFLGPDLQVTGAVLRGSRDRDVVVGGSVLLSDPSGVTAQLTFGMEHSYCAYYELRGSRGRLSLDRAFTPPAEYNPVIRIERQDHREEIVLPAADQFARIVRLFTDAVIGDLDLTSYQDDSLRAARLVDEIRAKAEHVYTS